MRSRWLGGSLAALAAGLVVPAVAAADQPACGQTVTSNVKLRKDILNCPSSGLIVGADNIRIDLNGHKLDGTGNGSGIDTNGHSGLRIRNGTVQQFENGVFLDGGHGNSVKRVRSEQNVGYGFFVNGSDGNRLKRDISLANAFAGFKLDQSDDNRLDRDSASSNAQSGFSVIGDRNVLDRVSSRSNRELGLIFDQGGDHEVIQRSLFSNNREGGILLRNVSNTTVQRNRADENDSGGDGIQVRDSDSTTTLTKNSANRNDNLGIDAAGVTDGGGNRAQKNGNPQQCVGVQCK